MLDICNIAVTASSVYRCLVRNNINNRPVETKPPYQKFKEYEPGFVHIDVTYLPKKRDREGICSLPLTGLRDYYSIKSMTLKLRIMPPISYHNVVRSFLLLLQLFSQIMGKSSPIDTIREEKIKQRTN